MDKVTTGTINFALLIRNLAEVVAVAATGRFPTTAMVLHIWDPTQYLDHDKSSSISQLIKEKSRDLQKLLRYFNGTTISASNIVSFGVLPIIFVLYSKHLLAVVLLLFII